MDGHASVDGDASRDAAEAATAAGQILVIGLGPGPADLLSARARRIWDGSDPGRRFVRTDRHPAVEALGAHRSFDAVYDDAARLDDVYPAIVEALVAEAIGPPQDGAPVLYAVPGSPLVAERTVELLRADRRVSVTVEPALSFLDLAWARLGVDPLAAGVTLVDGQRFAVEAAGLSGPLLVAQCDTVDVLSAIKLAVDEAPPTGVVVLQRLGTAEESVTSVAWDDLDRTVSPDHLTCLWIPALRPPVAAELVRFWELVRTLRERCPWDRQQTSASLRRYLLEEAHEVLDALDHLDADDGRGAEDVADELGDLLFQIVFHSVIAEEAGWFTLADVARGVHDKLVRRHPHVFGAVDAADVGTVVANWDEIKRAERADRAERRAPDDDAAPPGPFDGVPRALPALAYAAKLQRKAAGAGVVSPDPEGAVRSALDGLARAGEASADQLGAVLFALVDLSRQLGLDPEESLRDAANRFRADVEEASNSATER